jgi:hypothetical protein
LLNAQWVLIVVAVLLALAASVRARRTAKRLDKLAEAYWELRYEQAQLRARVNRLDPEPKAPGASTDPAAATGATTFVPLSSLKRGPQ